MWVVFIIIAIFLIYFIWNSIMQFKISKNTIIFFSGSLGTGKTFLAVKYSIKEYKRQMLLYRLKLDDRIPIYYSNIPVRLTRKKWAYTLTKEMLLLKDRVFTDSLMKDGKKYRPIILIDEIGAFASQFDYNNPNVQEQLHEFIRFFRHYTDGRMFITDQSAYNVAIQIKRRLGKIYSLNNFRRVMFFFYKVDVQEMDYTEDTVNVSNVNEVQQRPYFFGYLPFRLRWLKWLNLPVLRRYDSRCYSINYDKVEELEKPKNWLKYKTNYFIDLTPTPEQVKEYKEKTKQLR